jgi:MoaF N-terminal domain
MKQFLFFAGFFVMTSFHSTAQTKREMHLLDGTSMDINYETGSNEHIEFANGQIKWNWISGPGQHAAGQDSYKSKKIATRIYVVSSLATSTYSFITLIFDFNQNTLVASAIRIKDEANFLDSATIEQLHLKEN